MKYPMYQYVSNTRYMISLEKSVWKYGCNGLDLEKNSHYLSSINPVVCYNGRGCPFSCSDHPHIEEMIYSIIILIIQNKP